MSFLRGNDNTLDVLVSGKRAPLPLPPRQSTAPQRGTLGTAFIGIGASLVVGIRAIYGFSWFLGQWNEYPNPVPALMAWILLFIAGLLEVLWAFTMKSSHGFTRLVPTLITFVAMAISFGLLSVAMKTLPLGTAYTVWTGIGAVGAFVVGILVLGEQVTVMRVAAAVLIVSGLVLMKLSSPA